MPVYAFEGFFGKLQNSRSATSFKIPSLRTWAGAAFKVFT